MYCFEISKKNIFEKIFGKKKLVVPDLDFYFCKKNYS